jgi:hypothetical protein
MKPDWNAIAKVGIPGAIAIFLVYRLAYGFDSFDVRFRAIESQHAEMIMYTQRVEDLMGRTYMSNERVLFVLRVMCANAAKTPEARRLCLEEGK